MKTSILLYILMLRISLLFQIRYIYLVSTHPYRTFFHLCRAVSLGFLLPRTRCIYLASTHPCRTFFHPCRAVSPAVSASVITGVIGVTEYTPEPRSEAGVGIGVGFRGTRCPRPETPSGTPPRCAASPRTSWAWSSITNSTFSRSGSITAVFETQSARRYLANRLAKIKPLRLTDPFFQCTQ